MKRLLRLTGMLLFAVLVQIYGQNEGESAPDFEVGVLGGETFNLSEQKGKVVVLFFFGNTCSSCKAVGPLIESSIYQAFNEDSDFTTLGIDTWDSSSNESSVSGFKNATGITFPLGIKGGDVAAAYKSTYDRLMVIDKAGILVHKGLVAASNDVENAVSAIEEALTVTGVDEFSREAEPQVFPNPARDILHVRAREVLISGFTLFDLSGKKVRESAVNSGKTFADIDVSLFGLDPGVYFYSVQTEGSPVSGKLIIQK